jgi:transposase
MHTIADNATRIKRFRELKATLRTRRDRLLVGIDIAKARHVAQVRVAHTRILDAKLPIPNTHAGFAALWARLDAHCRDAGVAEIVCAVEPTGTYHQALATFLEAHGATVVFVSNHVAQLNRRTLDGTWDKNDPKDAHNLCDLLEQGKVLFYSLPDEPLGDLRRLVRLLRRARREAAACKARWRLTLRPLLGPTGEPLPPAVVAALPAPVRAFEPAAARRRAAGRPPAVLPAVALLELADLAAQLTAGQARMRAIEAELVRLAERLAAYRLLLTLPGIGPTLAAILVAEIGDIAWYTKFSQLRKLAGLDIVGVQTGQWTSGKRISKAGRALLRWALYQAAVGAARSPGWRARREALIAKRAGDRYAFFKANVELAAKLLRLVWGVWRSGRPYDPARALAPAGEPPRAAGRPRPAARGPRRSAERPRAGVRVTLGQDADGRVRFEFREPDDPAGGRRRR